MAFITISKPAVGEPTIKDLEDNIINNQVFLNNNIAASIGGLIINFSFETDADSDGEADGWDYTNYSGGSNALEQNNESGGINSQSFTSTVLANGGAYIDSQDYFEVIRDRTYKWSVMVHASVANISSQYQVTWFDNTKSSISTSTLFQNTNTPTSATLRSGIIQAPSTARYAKIKLEGGIPSVGSATGVIYFDVVYFDLFIITGTASTAGALGTTSSVQIILNAYSFFPMIHITDTGSDQLTQVGGHDVDGASPDNPRLALHNASGTDSETYDIDHRYITS